MITWTPKGGKPVPLDSLATPHIYAILRTIIRWKVDAWRTAAAKKNVPDEVMSLGPLFFAETHPVFEAAMRILDDRGLDWLQLYSELKEYSLDLVASDWEAKHAPLLAQLKEAL